MYERRHGRQNLLTVLRRQPRVRLAAALVSVLALLGGGVAVAQSTLAQDRRDERPRYPWLIEAEGIPNDQGHTPCTPTATPSATATTPPPTTDPPASPSATPSEVAPSETTVPTETPTSETPTPSPEASATERATPAAALLAAFGDHDHHGRGDGCGHGDGGGPEASNFIDIRRVRPNVRLPRNQRNASTGQFISQCGRNEDGHHNSDNFIVAPGVTNGAHHVHDYVGNVSADAFSTNESLAAAGTTCRRGDLSTYYWPVLRRIGTIGPDADADGGGNDLNVGEILKPSSVVLLFRGNPTSKVVAMPQFIRVITGDAKAGTNGPTNARARWTCSGFTNRVTTQYPLCPRGSQVQRILIMPSCWDGTNIDSANHRSHIVFPDSQSGACPEGTVAVPELRLILSYNVPSGRSFAVDSFPEQLHNPLTDHGDFVNVMPNDLMTSVVRCINSGRRC